MLGEECGSYLSTHHSSLITYYSLLSLRPFERAFAPRVVITNNQYRDKDKHLDESEFREREIVAHENNRPRQKKDRFHVKDQKQHRDDVITDRESRVGVGSRIDAAFIRPHLSLTIDRRPQEPSQNNWQNRKDDRNDEEDHHRPIRRDRCTDSLRSRCRCLEQHLVIETQSSPEGKLC